jgi:hypothetical protein
MTTQTGFSIRRAYSATRRGASRRAAYSGLPTESQYLPDVTKRADIHVSPINVSSEQLEGLPPQTLIIVDESGQGVGEQILIGQGTEVAVDWPA